MTLRVVALLAPVVSLALSGCRAAATLSPYETTSEVSRSTVEAEALSRKAADLIDSDPAKAEALLRESLTKDLFFGPAHNNLGVLFLKQEKLYEAAGEFEWAKKLMPGHPDPRVNLGITLERAGKTDEAIESYEAALETWPDYLPAVEGIASLTLRSGRSDQRLAGWLKQIAMQAIEPSWREWSHVRAGRIDQDARASVRSQP